MYQILPQFYDKLVDAKQGSEYFFQLLRNLNKEGSVLDCACGSGELVALLHENAYDVLGFDQSEKMLQQARYPELLTEQSLQTFKYNKKFDIITCFCDSVNYLLETKDLESFFQNAYHHLNNDGVLIFDMHNSETLAVYTDEYYQEGLIDGVAYQWSIVAENDLLLHTFVFDDLKEEHIQRVYDEDFIKELLQKCGFEVQELTDLELAGYESEKVLFIARKVL